MNSRLHYACDHHIMVARHNGLFQFTLHVGQRALQDRNSRFTFVPGHTTEPILPARGELVGQIALLGT